MIARNEIVEVKKECPVAQLRGLRARVLGNLQANEKHDEPGLLLEVLSNRGRTVKPRLDDEDPRKNRHGYMRYVKDELVGFRFRLSANQVTLTN